MTQCAHQSLSRIHRNIQEFKKRKKVNIKFILEMIYCVSDDYILSSSVKSNFLYFSVMNLFFCLTDLCRLKCAESFNDCF